MDFHVSLIVLAITLTSVLARPKDTVTRKIRASEGTKSTKSGSVNMKLPIPLQEGWIINIAGMLDPPNYERFEIVFPSKNSTEDYYRFIHDSKADKASTHANKNKEEQFYRLVAQNEDIPEYPVPFTLDIKAGPDNFTVWVNLNDAENLETKVSDVKTFEDLERIEFRSGLHSITSILMKMQQ